MLLRVVRTTGFLLTRSGSASALTQRRWPSRDHRPSIACERAVGGDFVPGDGQVVADGGDFRLVGAIGAGSSFDVPGRRLAAACRDRRE